jgi:hypothetical protein
MATDWPQEAKDAYADFKEDGFEISIRAEGSPGIWNPETFEYDGGTEDVDVSTYALRETFKIGFVDGTRIQSGDSILAFSAYGLPDITTSNIGNYSIVIGGVAVNIVGIVEKVAPGNVPVLYRIHVRD